MTSGLTAATVSTSAALQRRLARQVEQRLQVQQPQPSSFGNFFNISRLFLRFNHRSACSATSWATATSDSVITCGVQLPRRQLLQDASFQPLPVAFGNLNRGFYNFSHFFNNRCVTTGSTAAATGTSVTIGCTCLLPVRAALRPLHLADVQLDRDPDFARGQFRRCARYGQRHCDWVG